LLISNAKGLCKSLQTLDTFTGILRVEIDVDYSKSFSFAVKLDKILYFCKKRLEYEKAAKLQIPDKASN